MKKLTTTTTNHDAADRLRAELLDCALDAGHVQFEPDGNTPTRIRPLSSAERAAVERFLAGLHRDLAPLLDQLDPPSVHADPRQAAPPRPRPHLRLV